MATKAQQKAINKYTKEKTTCFTYRLHNEKEADVIAYLRSLPNQRQFFIDLVRKEIKKDQPR